MKKMRFIIGALFAPAIFFACTSPYIDNIEDGTQASGGQPVVEAVAGKVVLVLNTVDNATVCGQEIVLAGDYNGYNTDPSKMVRFEPVEGYKGWYKAVVTPSDSPSDKNYIIKGKPCSLAKDGTFPGSWDHQWFPLLNDAGAVEKPIELLGGSAELKEGYSNEFDLCVKPGADVVYLRTHSWKTNPCIEEDVYPIVFRVTLPNGALPDSCRIVVAGIGGKWDSSAPSLKPVGDGTLWTDTIPGVTYRASYKYAVAGKSGALYYELKQKEEGKDCSTHLDGNRTVLGRIQNDVVYEFDNITTTVCK